MVVWPRKLVPFAVVKTTCGKILKTKLSKTKQSGEWHNEHYRYTDGDYVYYNSSSLKPEVTTIVAFQVSPQTVSFINPFDIRDSVKISPIYYLKTQPASNQISPPCYRKTNSASNKLGYGFFWLGDIFHPTLAVDEPLGVCIPSPPPCSCSCSCQPSDWTIL